MRGALCSLRLRRANTLEQSLTISGAVKPKIKLNSKAIEVNYTFNSILSALSLAPAAALGLRCLDNGSRLCAFFKIAAFTADRIEITSASSKADAGYAARQKQRECGERIARAAALWRSELLMSKPCAARSLCSGARAKKTIKL